MLEKLRRYIRERRLMRAGDRVGVAVSGGADSVGLLRALLELRGELGLVLSVAHFNHKLRGAESDADEQFVRELADRHGLEFHGGRGDVAAAARERRVSVEEAGRELRYEFFRELLQAGRLDRVATAHTADDQAETVLMRFLRGAGTKGLAGIWPEQRVEMQVPRLRGSPAARAGRSARDAVPTASIVRPMLGVRRAEVRAYLEGLGQGWREDPSNADPKHLRNRVRQELLPAVERGVNPGFVEVARDLAEIARAEEEYWQEQVEAVLRRGQMPGREGVSVREDVLKALPLALRRRVLRAAAAAAGLRLEFEHVEEALRVAGGGKASGNLPGDWRLRRVRGELRFEHAAPVGPLSGGYEYRLQVPGEAPIPELGVVIKAVFLPKGGRDSGYNPAQFWDARKLGPELVVRNWRPGDRFHPGHTKSAKKVKELLAERRVEAGERALWPVATRGGKIVWVRGFPAPAEYAAGESTEQQVAIQESPVGSE